MTTHALKNPGAIPPELKRLRRWVCVGSSKVPITPSTDAPASVSDPSTWDGWDEASSAVMSGRYDYPGFVLGEGYVGIDIDRGFDEDGLISQMCRDIVHACRSYTEKSRSGRGVHIIVRASLPFSGMNNGEGAEIYGAGRYFIMTGRKLIYGEIIDNQDGVDFVLSRWFPLPVRAGGLPGPRQYSPVWTLPDSGALPLEPVYPPIGQGARNQSLFSLAGQLLDTGWRQDEIYARLSMINETVCSPPLPDSEIRRIARGIEKYRRMK